MLCAPLIILVEGDNSMLYICQQYAIDLEDMAKLYGRKVCPYPDYAYGAYAREEHDIRHDAVLDKLSSDIDNSYRQFPDIFRHRISDRTHNPFDVSTGVKTCWLANYYADRYVFESRHFGENCFQPLLDISVNHDVYVYDNSLMLTANVEGYSLDNCKGVFIDPLFHKTVTLVPGEENADDYNCWFLDQLSRYQQKVGLL